jgi:predicted amidohydrolase YtcJ
MPLEPGKITKVGDTKAVFATENSPKTQRIDLKGRTVLPGLVDSHVHALGAGLSEFRGPLPPLDSFDAIQSFIRDRMKSTPKGSWIVVPRTFPTRLKELQMPTREVLDVATEHPVMFDASYTVVVNSAALAARESPARRRTRPAGRSSRTRLGSRTGSSKTRSRC